MQHPCTLYLLVISSMHVSRYAVMVAGLGSLTCAITSSFAACWLSCPTEVASAGDAGRVAAACKRYSLPRLLVMMMTVLAKFTVRP